MFVPDAAGVEEDGETLMLLRMFSTDAAVREKQPLQVLTKQLFAGVPVQVSKKLAGNEVRPVHLNQAKLKVCPLETSIDGKLVRPKHWYQVPINVVPLEVLISGKVVRLLQFSQQ
jgi:hypothetical protein